MELEKEAQKEIERIEKIIQNLKVVDSKADGLLKVLNSYYQDSKSFFEKKQYLQALETAFIVWAYVDAGLHLKVFEVPDSLKRMFTV
ncbi:MAG: DUF357 domain-containing protein [Candidatus Aenigmatarchaeota archaeon]|nr:DUF357 domain-containing protein [Candidatus Aenigmarchaeota archaeon]